MKLLIFLFTRSTSAIFVSGRTFSLFELSNGWGFCEPSWFTHGWLTHSQSYKQQILHFEFSILWAGTAVTSCSSACLQPWHCPKCQVPHPAIKPCPSWRSLVVHAELRHSAQQLLSSPAPWGELGSTCSPPEQPHSLLTPSPSRECGTLWGKEPAKHTELTGPILLHPPYGP